MNSSKLQTHKYIEQTGGCQRKGGGERDKMSEGEKEMQAPSDGMNKSQGCKEQHRKYSQ